MVNTAQEITLIRFTRSQVGDGKVSVPISTRHSRVESLMAFERGSVNPALQP
jgi:hypothetical protein